jgi:hypothetical protein
MSECPATQAQHVFAPPEAPPWAEDEWDVDDWDQFYGDAEWCCTECGISEHDARRRTV